MFRRSIAVSAFDALEPRRLLSTVIHVDASAPGVTQDGATWATAYTSLQSALAVATAGSEVRVADGTYAPGVLETDTFVLPNDVQLVGGYAGYGAITPNARDLVNTPSVLVGPVPAGAGFARYTILTVSAAGPTTLIDGLTIGPATPISLFNQLATGVEFLNASPSVRNCTFHGLSYNAARMTYSSPTFERCVFDTNEASYGPAMWVEMSSMTARGCDFTENQSFTGEGGAIYAIDSQLSVADCHFIRNRARRQSAGAIYIAGGNAVVRNSAFCGNFAASGGGAMESQGGLSVINCAFVGNQANMSSGGAILGQVQEIRLSTFTQNHSGNRGGAVSATYVYGVTGSIFRDDTAYRENELDLAASTHVYACDVQGGWNGTGGGANMDADPQFVRNPSPGLDGTWGTTDDDYGDLRLQPYSPCIDVGHDSGWPPITAADKDLAGNPRIVDFPGVAGFGLDIDIGAYETPVMPIALGGQFVVDGPNPAFRITFNMPMDSSSIWPQNLKLTNLTTGQTIPTHYGVTVSYDASTLTATWSFPPDLLTDGEYTALLPAGAAQASNGQYLAVGRSYGFYTLAGDANRDRGVDISDLAILASNWQGSPRTFSQGDFNYDGVVDITDLAMLTANWQDTLPAPAPPLRQAAQRGASLRRASGFAGLEPASHRSQLLELEQASGVQALGAL